MEIADKFIQEAKTKQQAFESKKHWFEVQLKHQSQRIGKCSGTHTFNRDFRNNKSKYIHALRIEDVFISKDNSVYNEYHKAENKITFDELTPENIDTAKILIQYTSINIYTVIQGGRSQKKIESNVCFSTPEHLPITRVEIKPKVFEELLVSVEGAIESLLKKEGRTDLAKKYFYESHYKEDTSSRIDTLRNFGYKLVRIPNDMQLSRVIDWNPFVYRDHIVLSKESIQLIREKYQKIVKLDSMSANFCASYGERFKPTSSERDYRELLTFLEEQMKLLF